MSRPTARKAAPKGEYIETVSRFIHASRLSYLCFSRAHIFLARLIICYYSHYPQILLSFFSYPSTAIFFLLHTPFPWPSSLHCTPRGVDPFPRLKPA
jgi:hypothetical protein